MSPMEYMMIMVPQLLLLAAALIVECKVGEKLLEVSMNNDCVCPGDTLTYECTVVGDRGGITVWMGDFFRCPNGKKEIGLLHSDFTNGQAGGVYNTQTCNDGNVVGRIVRAGNGSFTSQLNVTLTSDTVGRSIECAYDNGTTHRIGSLNLTTDFASFSPPASISSATTLSQFYANRAFTWNTHSPDCSAIHYNIQASNCGSCPTTTNHTNVTCTDVPTDGSTCTFTVRTIVCGNITGESNQVSVLNNNLPECTCRSALISAVSLGVGLAICLIGLITVIILLMKSKIKVGTLVVNTTVDKEQSRSIQSSGINTKKNISYVVHSPKLNQIIQ